MRIIQGLKMSLTQIHPTPQPTLTLVPTPDPLAPNVAALHKSILSEAEIVQRLVQCGDCD